MQGFQLGAGQGDALAVSPTLSPPPWSPPSPAGLHPPPKPAPEGVLPSRLRAAPSFRCSSQNLRRHPRPLCPLPAQAQSISKSCQSYFQNTLRIQPPPWYKLPSPKGITEGLGRGLPAFDLDAPHCLHVATRGMPHLTPQQTWSPSAGQPAYQPSLMLLPQRACVQSRFSRGRLFATLWTVALQAPLSTGFSRQEY